MVVAEFFIQFEVLLINFDDSVGSLLDLSLHVVQFPLFGLSILVVR